MCIHAVEVVPKSTLQRGANHEIVRDTTLVVGGSCGSQALCARQVDVREPPWAGDGPGTAYRGPGRGAI